jgi:hypothetical protein
MPPPDQIPRANAGAGYFFTLPAGAMMVAEPAAF